MRRNLTLLATVLALTFAAQTSSSHAQGGPGAGGGSHSPTWAGAPVACLPNRAQRWDSEDQKQPCHCPPQSYCPDTLNIQPENINFIVSYKAVGGSNGTGVINGVDVPSLVDGSVTTAEVMGYSAGQLKGLLYSIILEKLGVETKFGTYGATIDLELAGVNGLDDWLNDTLKLPIMLASRCCDSICPVGLQPISKDKQVIKPRDPDEGIRIPRSDIEDLVVDLGKLKTDLQSAGGLGAQITATLDLKAALNTYLGASPADLPVLQPLANSLSSFNTLIVASAVPSSLKNKYKDTISLTKAFEQQVNQEIDYLKRPPEYITVSVLSCGKVVSYPREGCLIEGTQITMGDGSKKTIETLTLDDVIKGNQGPAKIIALNKFTQHDEYMYSINGGEAFFTVEHPVLTPKGWKSVDSTVTSIKSDAQLIGSLQVGDVILQEGGKELKVESITKTAIHKGVSAYNISVEGDGSYIANGFIMKGFKKLQMHY